MTLTDVYTVGSNYGKVDIVFEENEKPKFYLKPTGMSTAQRINEIVNAEFFEKVPIHHREHVLSKTFLRAVKLSDGSCKLYIHFRLLGGINILTLLQHNPNETDANLTRQVINNIPNNTFSYVQVWKCQYNFFGLGKKPAKVIALQPGSGGFDQFLIDLKRFFAGFSPDSHTYNSTALANLILGVSDTAEGRRDLTHAYNDKRAIYIYISQCGNFLYCDLEQAQSWCVVQ